MARSWPPGGFSAGAGCASCPCPVTRLNLLVSLYGLASHLTPTRVGQTQPPCPDHGREATHADVQLSAPVGPQLHPDSVGDGGLGGLLSELHHELTMNIPFQSIHFITYEVPAEQINPYRATTRSPTSSQAGWPGPGPRRHHPLDVCKTLLNTQENMALNLANISGRLSGMANAFRTVYQLNGLPGYFKGVQAR